MVYTTEEKKWCYVDNLLPSISSVSSSSVICVQILFAKTQSLCPIPSRLQENVCREIKRKKIANTEIFISILSEFENTYHQSLKADKCF